MAMANKGLAKLTEECGELQQVCGKKIQYMHTDNHPDGTNLRIRMLEEMADVVGAMDFIIEKFEISPEELQFLKQRAREKQALFQLWDKEQIL